MTERVVYEDDRVVVLVREKAAPPAPEPPTPPTPTSVPASPLYGMVNGARKAGGLGMLARDLEAERIAQGWAEELARTDDFHHNPNLSGLLTEPWFSVGENIAWTFGTSSRDSIVHQMWMDSPPHRRNIENPAYTALGVGVAENAAGRRYWVEVFVDRLA